MSDRDLPEQRRIMNAAKPVAPPKHALDQGAAVKLLSDSVAELRESGDVMGLVRVQGLALALADASGGRTRRRSLRVANKASSAAADLRKNGVETPEEREAREARELREARWGARDAKNRLSERFVALLHMILSDDSQPLEGIDVFRQLQVADDEGYVRVEIPDVFESWAPVLVDGYQQTERFYMDDDPGELRRQRETIERHLKSVAVGLMAAGAEVRGLTEDVVPLIAYAIFTQRLPVLPAAETAAAVEKVDDLLLRMADDVSAMPAKTRPLFVGLFRLAMLLGEAQAYSEQLSLRAFSFS